MASGSKGKEPASRLSEQDLSTTIRQRTNEIQSLVAKISELEQEAEEHTLVIGTLQEAPPDRKCFRMVGGVLVERIVKDVLPELESNLAQIKELIDTLMKEYQKKEADFSKWQRDNDVVIKQR